MKVIALRSPASAREARLVDEMYKLRARVFGERLAWNVAIRHGRETDEFDTLNPTYILAVTPASQVAGCARLLPATGPTMLSKTFPQLLAGGKLASHPQMVESSRFCVDTLLDGWAGGPIRDATRTMFAGIIEWCIREGFTEIATATDVVLERILKRSGWPLERLGEPMLIGKTLSVAGVLPTNQAVFERLRPHDYSSEFDFSCSAA